jgi:Rrf2 family protein
VKISKRGEYALRALIDFGLAEAANRPLLQASELALREDFPVKFLEQILMQLRTGSYIKSRRGKLGGYLLARPPENICIGDTLGGLSNASLDSMSRTAPPPAVTKTSLKARSKTVDHL